MISQLASWRTTWLPRLSASDRPDSGARLPLFKMDAENPYGDVIIRRHRITDFDKKKLACRICNVATAIGGISGVALGFAYYSALQPIVMTVAGIGIAALMETPESLRSQPSDSPTQKTVKFMANLGVRLVVGALGGAVAGLVTPLATMYAGTVGGALLGVGANLGFMPADRAKTVTS